MGLLLLKLGTVGLNCKLVYIPGKTVQDMDLDSCFRQIASSPVTSRRFQDVFARRLAIMSSRRLQDVLEDKKMLH